jgi:hypothetical protein
MSSRSVGLENRAYDSCCFGVSGMNFWYVRATHRHCTVVIIFRVDLMITQYAQLTGAS